MPSVGSFSENGWSPARVGQESLVWVTVPGTSVHLQIQNGWPATIMSAFAADFNAYVEPLRDRDSASWTPTNSVPTSNHLNGTAMDLNWDSHPFHVKNTFGPSQLKTIRELLDFYEDTIYWGGDWTDPIDEMHFQMGYETYNSKDTSDFIIRKIRANGFSTFRRKPVVIPAQEKKEDKVLMALSNDEQAELLNRLRELHAAFCSPISSGARYKNDGEGPIWTRAQMISNDDALDYDNAVESHAINGDPQCIALVKRQMDRGDTWAKAAWNAIPARFKGEDAEPEPEVTVSNGQKSEAQSVKDILDRISHDQ